MRPTQITHHGSRVNIPYLHTVMAYEIGHRQKRGAVYAIIMTDILDPRISESKRYAEAAYDHKQFRIVGYEVS